MRNLIHGDMKKIVQLIECKYPIDVDEQPSLFEGWQLKFTWEGKKELTIEEAAQKFRKKFEKTQWFHDVICDNGTLDVTLKTQLNHRFDFYENYPVRYGYLPNPEEEELKNLIP